MESDLKAAAKATRMPADRRIPKLIQVRRFGHFLSRSSRPRQMAEVFLGYGRTSWVSEADRDQEILDLAEDPRLVQMFDEARLAARLHHPNVADD